MDPDAYARSSLWSPDPCDSCMRTGARSARARPALRQDGDDGGVALALRPAVTAAQHRPVACPTLRSGTPATFAAYWRSETQFTAAFSASESGVLDGPVA